MHPVLTFTPDICSHYSLSTNCWHFKTRQRDIFIPHNGSCVRLLSQSLIDDNVQVIITSEKGKAILWMWDRENGSYQSRDDPEMTNENPLSVVGSALTVFDDDKLIHESNLFFNNVFNGQSNTSIFICSTATRCLSGSRYFHRRWMLFVIKEEGNDFLRRGKRSHHVMH